MRILAILLLLPSVVAADCRVGDIMESLRPGAVWNLRGTTYEGLEWIDEIQSKPTKQEVITAYNACIADLENRITLKQQAKAIVKDEGKTAVERLRALILLLDLDR